MTESIPATPILATICTTFNLNDVRPQPEHCPPEQFDVFLNAYFHVQNHPEEMDTSPLHAAIRESVNYFTTKGNYSLANLKDDLRSIAESAHLLTGSQLASGLLSYEWAACIVQDGPELPETQHNVFDPIWLDQFLYACHGFQLNDYTAELNLFTEGLLDKSFGRGRLKFLETWATAVAEIGKAYLVSQQHPLPQVSIMLVDFPKPHLILQCTQPTAGNPMLKLTIREIRDSVFQLELEWNSGTSAPLLSFEIPHLIAEANSLDKLVLEITGIKPASSVKIDPRGASIAA